MIDDFVDDMFCDRPPEQVFGRAQPAGRPRASEPPTADVAQQPSKAYVRPAGDTDREKSEKPVRQAPSSRVGHTGRGNDAADIRPIVRAELLLSARLRAPRKASLTPVLSTLQPEQYRLITAPATRSMIMEGKPGSGKSTIASHRAT
ncbi:hypothetical protein [Mycobacterium camsae]|uniref:hypothetical protein n=1 Tax=Mycobacterium gordonae TaxID=1778 RepID=UPI00197D808C|nr:hypothetical protein [Mycobacterium gordonae]